MCKIKKSILQTLAIIIIMATVLPYIKNNDIKANAPIFNDKIIDIQLLNNNHLDLYWKLEINSQQSELSGDIVTLDLNQLHQFDQKSLEEQLTKLDIKFENINNNLLLTLPDKNKSYSIDLHTVREKDTIENATIVSTLKTKTEIYESRAVHITTQDIEGHISYTQYPSNINKTTTIHLVDSINGDVIETQKKDNKNSYSFKNIPRYTEEGAPINYSILTDKETNIDTTINKFDISQKYMEQEIKGKINNLTGKSLLIQLLKENSGEVVKELKVEKNEKSFKFSNIPVEDELGRLSFQFSVEGEETEYKDNTLIVGSTKATPRAKRSIASQLPRVENDERDLTTSNHQETPGKLEAKNIEERKENKTSFITSEYNFSKSDDFKHRQGLMIRDVIGKINGIIDKKNQEIIWNIDFSFDGTVYNPTVQLNDIKFSDNLKVIEILKDGDIIADSNDIDLGIIGSSVTLQIRTKILNTESPIYKININDVSVYNQKRGSLWAQFQMITETPQVDDVTNLHEQLDGKSEPNAKVTVKDSYGKVVGSGYTNQEGNYSIKITKQKIGAILLVTATSPNKIESPEAKVTVTKDERTPLKDVVVQDVYDIETGVRGVSEENTFILIKNKKGTILGSTKATKNGDFYIDLHSTFPAGTELIVVAYDGNGKFSKETSFVVKKTENGQLPSNIYAQRVNPSPTFDGKLGIKNMAWDTRNNLRNQVPQPVEYEAGFLSKYAYNTAHENQYDIHLKTQGRSNINKAPLDIILVIDNSGSMGQSRWFGQSRWKSMEEVLYPFIKNMTENNKNTRFAVVNYATGIVSQQGFSNDYATIRKGIPSGPQSAYGSYGGTFTQLGIREGAKYMNHTRPEAEKVMILLTDGAPSYSYQGTSASGPEDITQFSSKILGKGTSFNLSQFSEFLFQSYELNGHKIENHGQATISESKLIKQQYPELTLFGVGLDLDLDTHFSSTAQRTRVLEQVASFPKYSFNTSNILDQDEGLERILTTITETVSKSISNGVVTDPIGEMYDLDLGNDGMFNEEDYTITASDTNLLKDVKVTYNQYNRIIQLKDLTLGNGEWVDIRYKVKLKVNNSGFQNNQWYPMNKKTELIPFKGEKTIEYPVPEAKYKKPLFKFQFNKVDERHQPLDQAIFKISGENINKTAESKGGKVIFEDLKPGIYEITETKAPIGYIKTDKKYKLEVTDTGIFKIDDNIIKNFEVINTKAPTVGSVKVIKHDSKNINTLLSEAEFEIRNKSDVNLVKRGATKEDGEIIFNDLPIGEYELVEVKAPKNYQLNKKVVTITLSENNIKQTIHVSNVKVILPATGGRGIINFIFLGGLIVTLSIVMRRKTLKN